MDVSIVICTCNRAEDLKQTLESLAGIEIPEGLKTELILVDNASTDATPEVIALFKSKRFEKRCFHEARPGQARARNKGLREAAGDVILFTDDDVRFDIYWLQEMIAALRAGCQAVTGEIRIAPHLKRDWMEPFHYTLLASTELWTGEGEGRLVGASMGFMKECLVKVPWFDENLGPGALGFNDDSLFAEQLKHAGYKLGFASKAKMTHHFLPNRLLRGSWISRMEKQGICSAYVKHHWEHEIEALAPLRLLRHKIGLTMLSKRSESGTESEGTTASELYFRYYIAYYQEMARLRGQTRKYGRRGLTAPIGIES